ncbi:hypothetical protein [Hymenobacter jejuensis]|uniref:Uncharacterized protein n=1 Tax=Hymenobacter jejuensis TaxID=2502781 RepID=A0A5B7ZWH2_9BACT|nr:hypothetical protein [Hymenobacter jejuensis]QDA58955.1 hypothetical protein FHG12_02040 [Hymenobacter jejuensis]
MTKTLGVLTAGGALLYVIGLGLLTASNSIQAQTPPAQATLSAAAADTIVLIPKKNWEDMVTLYSSATGETPTYEPAGSTLEKATTARWHNAQVAFVQDGPGVPDGQPEFFIRFSTQDDTNFKKYLKNLLKTPHDNGHELKRDFQYTNSQGKLRTVKVRGIYLHHVIPSGQAVEFDTTVGVIHNPNF